tara:strand:+ start:1981 stop:2550 length:570 start_codon:yes stop_codon:yes gene_type:complete
MGSNVTVGDTWVFHGDHVTVGTTTLSKDDILSSMAASCDTWVHDHFAEHYNRSAAVKKVRAREALEVQRGLAMRKVTLDKRATKRAMIHTEKEKLKYDNKCAQQDRHNAKSGKSKTMFRLMNPDDALEVHQGLAQRKMTLDKRAMKRASMNTEKEKLKYDKKCTQQDRYNAKSGRSKTMCRLVNQGYLV